MFWIFHEGPSGLHLPHQQTIDGCESLDKSFLAVGGMQSLVSNTYKHLPAGSDGFLEVGEIDVLAPPNHVAPQAHPRQLHGTCWARSNRKPETSIGGEVTESLRMQHTDGSTVCATRAGMSC